MEGKCTMGRPRKYKKRRNVTIAMEDDLYVHLQRQALDMGTREGRLISINETATRAFLTTYPLPNQEMFKF